MAQFTKHVGKHGDRKVAIVFREVPGEPHMALVVYTELLNRGIHDPLIDCINSDIGQSSDDLANALNRTYTTDGQIILQKLHAEGMLKKVNTENIIMTPAPNIKIKLNELNKILDEMAQGEEAIKKLAEMDKQLGMQDPYQVAKRMRESRDARTPETIPPVKQPVTESAPASNGALNDTVLAANLRSQADRMTREANGLLNEAKYLEEQANQLDPVAVPAVKKKTKVVKSVVETVEAPVVQLKPRGRPKKTVTVA